MKDLQSILNRIEQNIQNHKKLNESISQATVGWQLEHIMLVLNNIIKSIEESDPQKYRFQFKPIRYYIMLRGSIPRGKGRAPKGVQPKEVLTLSRLKEDLNLTKANIQKLKTLNPNQYFTHPLFGNMKLKSAIQFLGIHSRHHLDIIDDIVNG